MRSLCETCVHLKVISSASGARFLMCLQSKADPRFPKYPPQPLLRCPGHREDARPAPRGQG